MNSFQKSSVNPSNALSAALSPLPRPVPASPDTRQFSKCSQAPRALRWWPTELPSLYYSPTESQFFKAPPRCHLLCKYLRSHPESNRFVLKIG